MRAEMIDPAKLLPNPWNSNQLTPDMEHRLTASIVRLGMFKPIIVRSVAHETGEPDLQILGGQHRAEVAARLGIEVPIVNLGFISDQQAKEIGIIDNGRYGHDQADLLAKLLEDLGDPKELSGFMPFDMAEIDSMASAARIDLDSLELEEHDAAPVEKPARAERTHNTMKLKVPIDEQLLVQDQIEAIISDQGIEDSDGAVRAGEALVWLVRAWQGMLS